MKPAQAAVKSTTNMKRTMKNAQKTSVDFSGALIATKMASFDAQFVATKFHGKERFTISVII